MDEPESRIGIGRPVKLLNASSVSIPNLRYIVDQKSLGVKGLWEGL